jgi:hypothetical protein
MAIITVRNTTIPEKVIMFESVELMDTLKVDRGLLLAANKM